MRFYKIDTIVRESLMTKRFPIHYYVIFLHLALKGMRELHYMFGINPKGIKAVRLPIDHTAFTADLPSDYIDYWVVAYETKNKLRPIGQKDILSKLTGKDLVAHPIEAEIDDYGVYRFVEYINSQDGFAGGIYGYGGGIMPNSFRVVPELNKIQFDPGIEYDEIYLSYVSDGIDPNWETEVHPYAVEPIQAYIDWQFMKNSRLPKYSRFDVAVAKDEWGNEVRKLRARIDKIGPVEIKRSLKRAFRRTYK